MPTVCFLCNGSDISILLHSACKDMLCNDYSICLKEREVTVLGVQLLGELLLDRANVKVMMRYVSDSKNLQMMMTLLKDNSRSIQFEAFHVFKVLLSLKPAEGIIKGWAETPTSRCLTQHQIRSIIQKASPRTAVLAELLRLSICHDGKKPLSMAISASAEHLFV